MIYNLNVQKIERLSVETALTVRVPIVGNAQGPYCWLHSSGPKPGIDYLS